MASFENLKSGSFQALFEKFDINVNDIDLVKPTFSIDEFINKKVDAMAVYETNELYFLDKINYKYNIIDPNTYGIKFYDLNFFTSKEEYEKHPMQVHSMQYATIKGWEYAIKHPEEIIDIILKKYNTQNKTRESLEFEAKKL